MAPERWKVVSGFGGVVMSVGAFQDGTCIALPDGYRPVPVDESGRYMDDLGRIGRPINGSAYLKAGRTDGFFFKQPTDHHFGAMRKYFRGLFWPGILGKALNYSLGAGTLEIPLIRRPTYEESPRNIDKLRLRFPELADVTTNLEYLHFLMLYKLQHERLLSVSPSGVPGAAFLLIRRASRSPVPRPMLFQGRQAESEWEASGWPVPSVVQESIDGQLLWNMVDRHVAKFLPQWEQAGKPLAQQLRCYVESEHVDCNPKNFMFVPGSGALFYIDSEPTFIRTKRTNDVNKAFLLQLMSEYT